MSVTDELLKSNADYASNFSEGDLPMPPSRNVAIVACMDARLMVGQVFGLKNGEAHVIRNAGGIVNAETLRSLVISTKLLATKEILIVNHTDCGMLTFKDEELQAKVRGEHGGPVDTIPFYTFTDVEENVAWQVRKVRDYPLLDDGIPVRGFVYDVNTGKANEVQVPN